MIRLLKMLLPLAAVVSSCGLVFVAVSAQGEEQIFSRELPIKVTSTEGIEWQRDDKLWIARGDVIAEQGLSKLFSQILIVHYRAKEEDPAAAKKEAEPVVQDETSLITKIEVEQEVRLETPNFTATGNEGSYDVEELVFTVKGEGSKIVFASGVVVGGDDSLEMWELKNVGVARGNAWIKRPDGAILRGEKLVAYFAEEKQADQRLGELEKVDAFDDISITQKQEKITGDKGIYESRSGTATVIGNVVITRPSGQFYGEYGTMNLNSGISKLLPLPASPTASPPLNKGRTAEHGKPTPDGDKSKAPPRRVRAVIDLSKRKSDDKKE